MNNTDINEHGRTKPSHTRLVLTCDNERSEEDAVILEIEGNPLILTQQMSRSLAMLVEKIASTVLKSDGSTEGNEELRSNEEYLLRLIISNVLAIINNQSKESN